MGLAARAYAEKYFGIENVVKKTFGNIFEILQIRDNNFIFLIANTTWKISSKFFKNESRNRRQII